MTALDIPLGMRLKSQSGWNQLEADWFRLIDMQPDGCFVAECDGTPAGTVATCLFGDIAWIAMMLVDESLRGRGIGRALMQHSLDFLDCRLIRSVRLDATPLGRPLYEKLGFFGQFELARHEGVPHAVQSGGSPQIAVESQLEQIIALDSRFTSTDRRKLLSRLFAERPHEMRIVQSGNELAGYLTTRPGSRAVLIGPCVADPAVGEVLLRDACGRLQGRYVYIDIPEDNAPAAAMAVSNGLKVQRHLLRMCRGEIVCENVARLWCSSGPEKG